ncbi:MAG: hypothetical protein GX971_06910 [Firmicutes bacterium]|nr:hypothetical protein [Bacillota bacterium]
MQVRKLNFFLVVTLVTMLSGTVLAQGIPVDIPGTGVNFFLYRYEGQNPHEKINDIWANLTKVFSDWVEAGQKPGALSGKDVQIKTNSSGSVSLYVKDQFILEVDQYHAQANKATPAQLAEKWAANLRAGVDAFVTINELK